MGVKKIESERIYIREHKILHQKKNNFQLTLYEILFPMTVLFKRKKIEI